MRIGIIGSGNIGATAARLFVDAGHEVAIANSRGPETLGEVVDGLGPRAHAAEASEAASFGEVVLVAIPFGRYRELPASELADTTVIDATNYYPQRDGNFPELDADTTTRASCSPPTSRARGWSRRSTRWTGGRCATAGSRVRGERLALFIAGDDPGRRTRWRRLIEEIGFAAVDTGGLADGGRRQQMGSPLIGREVTAREAEEVLTPSQAADLTGPRRVWDPALPCRCASQPAHSGEILGAQKGSL